MLSTRMPLLVVGVCEGMSSFELWFCWWKLLSSVFNLGYQQSRDEYFGLPNQVGSNLKFVEG
jgi:hypothetical protein